MSTRRERLENKLLKRQEWGQKASARSAERFATARRISSFIPFGQPILVGHHSERRARRDAERIHNNMGKGCELQDLAAHHAGAAAGIEHQLKHSIFSDDENAVEALEAKITGLEAKQSKMKAANAAIRKHKKAGEEAQIAALVAIGYPEGVAKLLVKPDYCGRIGHADYETKNNNANIRRLKARLVEVKARQSRMAKAEAAGVLVEGTGDYVRVTFPEKPAREVLEALRSANFHWGRRILDRPAREVARGRQYNARVVVMTKAKTPGRPPLPAREKKCRWIQVRVTDEEHNRFALAASVKGISVGKLVRDLLKRSAAALGA